MKASAASNQFSVEIESLRGIAALSVVLGHFYLVTILPQYLLTHSHLERTLISGLFNPQPAVLLFFTISGLVLGRQLRKETIDSFPAFMAYLCRRGFRLIPLMWATTIFAFLLSYLTLHQANFAILYANLTLKDISLNIPLWSLKVELCCSVFFPILFWAFVTGGKVWNAALFLSLAVISYVWQEPIFVQFFVFFHAGLLIDYWNAKCTKPLPFVNAFTLLAFVLVFILAPEFSIGPRNWTYGFWQSWVLPEILACSFILFYIVHKTRSRLNQFLRLSFVRYLGKISFSIYLFHFPLLFFMLGQFKVTGFYSLMGFLACYLTSVIALSSATFHWIEMPTNRLGRRLASYLLESSRRNEVLINEASAS